MTEEDNSHLFFARKLAHNDLDIRTTTLTNLSKFFSKSVNELREEDLLKIWMGLFYAMWMSDKPKVQRELAENISKLIHSFSNTENTILFIKTFYVTMHRQFPAVDRLRHDKFLKFVRFFVHHSLKFIKDQEYSTDIIEKYIAAQTNIWQVDDAQEIQLHVCDLFFDELFYACGNEIPSEALFQLAGLFADTLVKTNHAILKARLYESLKALISGASYCSPKLAPKKKRGMEVDKELFPDVEFVNVKLEELVDWLMKRASTTTPIQNRDLLYKLKDEALRKQRAEPGFRLLPRTSIVKTVAEVEKDEFKRLMDEHKRAQDALPKEKILTKKEARKKRKADAEAKAEALANGEEVPEKNDQKVEDITKAQEPQKGKKGKKAKAAPAAPVAVPEESPKQNKNKKQKVDTTPSTPSTPSTSSSSTPSTPSTTTTTTKVTKRQKKANGEVVGKEEKVVETVVTEDATTKKTEITTTTTTSVKTPTKGGKKAQEEKPAAAAAAVVVEKKGKGKREEEEKEDAAPEEVIPTKKAKVAPVAAANGKKRKATEVEVEAEEKVAEVEPAQNGSAKKGEKATPKADMVTPQKSVAPSATTPPSTGKKSVRFSKNNHVKEFDKLAVVATTPVTPSSAQPKSVLNTPPAKPKVGKKK